MPDFSYILIPGKITPSSILTSALQRKEFEVLWPMVPQEPNSYLQLYYGYDIDNQVVRRVGLKRGYEYGYQINAIDLFTGQVYQYAQNTPVTNSRPVPSRTEVEALKTREEQQTIVDLQLAQQLLLQQQQAIADEKKRREMEQKKIDTGGQVGFKPNDQPVMPKLNVGRPSVTVTAPVGSKPPMVVSAPTAPNYTMYLVLAVIGYFVFTQKNK